MKKLVYAVAVVLAMGSSVSMFAQEPEKKDSTTVETPKDTTPSSFAMMQEPEKKDSTTVEEPKNEAPASLALVQEPEKKEQPEPTDSTKQEKPACFKMKLA